MRTRMFGLRKLIWPVFIHGAPILVLALGVGGMFALANRKVEPKRGQIAESAPLVRTVTVHSYPGGLDLELDGVVVPFREVELAAEVAGRVVEKSENCRPGRFVRKGQVLLRIDPRDYELEVKRLEQQLAQSSSLLDDLRVEQTNGEALIELGNEEWELQKVELERVESLRNNLTATDLDRAKRAEWSSRHSLQSLRNQLQLLRSRERGLKNAVDLAQAQLDKAQLDLQRTTVCAPLDGVVVEDLFEQDTYLQKGARLIKIEDTSRVEVRCNLRMQDLAWVWQHSTADSPIGASFDDKQPSVGSMGRTNNLGYELPSVPVSVVFRPAALGSEFVWTGTLSRYDGLGLDEKTRTVPCRVEVSNPQEVRTTRIGISGSRVAPPALLRGMYVQLLFHLRPAAELLKVPEIAVQPSKRVLRVRNGRIEFVGPVSLAKRLDSAGPGGMEHYFLIPASADGLQSGDHVVSSPLVVAEPGLEVREESSPEPTAHRRPDQEGLPASDDSSHPSSS